MSKTVAAKNVANVAVFRALYMLACMAAGALVFWVLAPPPTVPITKPMAQIISAAEVSDLLARLRPLVKEPNGPWYSNGLELSFMGNGYTRIKLKMPNGDEYSGAATTLQGAVATLGKPSQDIQAALRGWNDQR